MKISIFTTYTEPELRNDPWREALNCYEDFADEVVTTFQSYGVVKSVCQNGVVILCGG